VGSGIHATVAGVLLAMTLPVRTRIDERAFLTDAERALDEIAIAGVQTQSDPETAVLSNRLHHASLKPLGIAGLSWIAIKPRSAALPPGVSGRMLTGAGMLGGIGFTMSLFVAGLAFGEVIFWKLPRSAS
jgi:NhaA family Na+:H+ antiporter